MAGNTKFLVHGTPNEVVKAGGSVARLGTCCGRKMGADGKVSVQGCPFYYGMNAVPDDPDTPWLECPLKNFRGKDWRGMGPLNLGVHEAKRIFGADGQRQRIPVPRTMTCYHIPERKAHLEQNKGGLRVVAMEGEEFSLPESKREQVDPLNPLAGVVFNSVVSKVKITRFPRPGEKPNMVDQSLAAEIIAESAADTARANLNDAFTADEPDDDPEKILDGMSKP